MVDEVVAVVNEGVITLSKIKREAKGIVDAGVQQHAEVGHQPADPRHADPDRGLLEPQGLARLVGQDDPRLGVAGERLDRRDERAARVQPANLVFRAGTRPDAQQRHVGGVH